MGEQTILKFEAGTLILENAARDFAAPESFVWDERTKQFRAPAYEYRHVVKKFVRNKIDFKDEAQKYLKFDFKPKFHVEPREYQIEAIEAWRKNERCGNVILPTGAGKSFVAQMAIEICGRQTLVIVPTIDLMNQWYDLLISSFNAEIGLIGGGFYEIGAITVTTYASAFRHQERIGNQFGLIIFDECHHLPSEGYKYAAEFAIAPFRLGLTATPERADGNDKLLENLVGATVYRREAQEFAGEYLADYTIEQITVDLSETERESYEAERAIFKDFTRKNNIPFGSINGWKLFVMQSARSEQGRRAMKAFRESKRIALGTDAKLQVLKDLLIRHKREKILIFTAENAAVFRISRDFLIPSITHETNVKERRAWLEAFNGGEIMALATSKVLNEGVNVPDASVAIILSGSGSSREHIQRLGRILRKHGDKQAILYEVVTTNTTEEAISRRRTDARQFNERKN